MGRQGFVVIGTAGEWPWEGGEMGEARKVLCGLIRVR